MTSKTKTSRLTCQFKQQAEEGQTPASSAAVLGTSSGRQEWTLRRFHYKPLYS